MAEKKKKVAERAKILQGVVPLTPQDTEGSAKWPTITDLLAPRWSEGVQTRLPGRIALRVEGSCYRVTIECPTEGLMTSVMTDSLVGVLDKIETTVATGRAVWVLTYEAARRGRQLLEPSLE